MLVEAIIFVLLLAVGYLIFREKKGNGNVKEAAGSFMKEIKERIGKISHAFNLAAAIGLAIVLFIFAPNKFYFFAFTAFFAIVIYHAMRKIANLKHVLTIDFATNKLGLYQMSQKRFNSYDIVDETGRAASVNYRMYGKKAEVIIADGIRGRKIILNPVVSNIEFARNYKDVAMRLKEKLNEMQNQLLEKLNEMQNQLFDVKAKYHYEVMLKATELLERLSVVDKINLPFENENGNGQNLKVIDINAFKKRLDEWLKEMEAK